MIRVVMVAAAAQRRGDQRDGLHGGCGGVLLAATGLERRHVRARRRPLGQGHRLHPPRFRTSACTPLMLQVSAFAAVRPLPHLPSSCPTEEWLFPHPDPSPAPRPTAPVPSDTRRTGLSTPGWAADKRMVGTPQGPRLLGRAAAAAACCPATSQPSPPLPYLLLLCLPTGRLGTKGLLSAQPSALSTTAHTWARRQRADVLGKDNHDSIFHGVVASTSLSRVL